MVALSATGRESILSILGRKLTASRVLTRSLLAVILRFMLVVGGLALLSAAAWTLAMPAGLAVAGVSCLILEWVVKR